MKNIFTLKVVRYILAPILSSFIFMPAVYGSEGDACQVTLSQLKKLGKENGKIYKNQPLTDESKARLKEISKEQESLFERMGNSCDHNTDLLASRVWRELNKDHNKANELVDKLIKLNPDNAEAWYLKATISIQDRDMEKGVQFLSKALAIDPTHKMSNYDLCSTLITTKHYPRAIGQCSKALEYVHEENLPFIYAYRARAHFKNGDENAAKRDWGKAQELGMPPGIINVFGPDPSEYKPVIGWRVVKNKKYNIQFESMNDPLLFKESKDEDNTEMATWMLNPDDKSTFAILYLVTGVRVNDKKFEPFPLGKSKDKDGSVMDIKSQREITINGFRGREIKGESTRQSGDVLSIRGLFLTGNNMGLILQIMAKDPNQLASDKIEKFIYSIKPL